MKYVEDAYVRETLVLDGAKAESNFNIAQESGIKHRRIVIFHLTRREGGRICWTSVEGMKDGRFNSSKWHGARNKGGDIPNPHIIIFSNARVDFGKDENGHYGVTLSRMRIGYIDSPQADIRWFRVNEETGEDNIPLEDDDDLFQNV